MWIHNSVLSHQAYHLSIRILILTAASVQMPLAPYVTLNPFSPSFRSMSFFSTPVTFACLGPLFRCCTNSSRTVSLACASPITFAAGQCTVFTGRGRCRLADPSDEFLT